MCGARDQPAASTRQLLSTLAKTIGGKSDILQLKACGGWILIVGLIYTVREFVHMLYAIKTVFSSYSNQFRVTRKYQYHRIDTLPAMASGEEKQLYFEKQSSPTSSTVEPGAEAGQVGELRRRWPGFSLEVQKEESSFAKTKGASNADFDPIPPSKRTWNWGAYVAYWMADAWAVSNWEVGQSIATPATALYMKCDTTDTVIKLPQ